MNTEEEDKIAHAILDRTITLRRLSANEQRKVLVIIQKMEEDLIYSLLHDDLTAFGRRDKARLLSQAQSIIEDYYSRAGDEMAQTLMGLSRAEAEFITSTLGDTLIDMNFGLPTEGYFKSVMSDVLIQGAPSADWWKRQAGDVSFRFANEVRQGLIQGDSNPQIIKRVQDIMGIPRNNAAALVQTSVQTIANDSRRKTFEKNSDVVQGIQQISTLDSHTSIRCLAYSGARWTLEGLDPIAPSTLPYDGGVPRHFNCLVGDSLITTRGDVTGCSKRWFDGDVFIITTASGRKLTCTPNHPILTNKGWIAANLLNIGCYVISDGGGEWGGISNSNSQDIPTKIHDFTESWLGTRQVCPMPVPLSTHDFHGDGGGSKIAIIYSDCFLRDSFNASIKQHFGQNIFSFGASAVAAPFVSLSHSEQLFSRHCSSSNGIIGSLREILSFFQRSKSHAGELLLTAVARLNAIISKQSFNQRGRTPEPFGYSTNSNTRLEKGISILKINVESSLATQFNTSPSKPSGNSCCSNIEQIRQFINGFTGEIFADEIINIEINSFHGEVFNLETEGGWYTANGIITHNCRSVEVPIFKNKDGTWSEPGGTRASDIGQIDAKTTMADFIRMKGPGFADRLLGVGRAQLFLDGKISLTQLLDQSGRPISLKQLNEMYQ